MGQPATDFLVVGAGIFGVAAALELRVRGYTVRLLDPGPLPHPLAASTDISKVVRMEYGPDREYLRMVDQAITGFKAWNEAWGEALYHETGVLMMGRQPMAPGDYLYESYHALLAEGHRPERMDAEKLRERFPAWNADLYVDGFYSPRGGWVESGRVVARLIQAAQAAGVDLQAHQTAAHLLESNGRVTGVHTREGETFHAEHTLVAAGAWTPYLVPELQAVIRVTGHPVFHLRPAEPSLFSPPGFVVFTADVAHTGWYGFPLHPTERVVKIGHHGVGLPIHPDRDDRLVYDDDIARLRLFLAKTFPALAEAAVVYTRRCLYTDTLDEHFWIDRHPEREGLSVAGGGSGHGFKFAPVLGPLIADVVEGRPNPWAAKFRWRELSPDTRGQEASRFHGEGR